MHVVHSAAAAQTIGQDHAYTVATSVVCWQHGKAAALPMLQHVCANLLSHRSAPVPVWRQVTAPSREEEEATGLVDWLPFLLEDRLKVAQPCAA